MLTAHGDKLFEKMNAIRDAQMTLDRRRVEETVTAIVNRLLSETLKPSESIVIFCLRRAEPDAFERDVIKGLTQALGFEVGNLPIKRGLWVDYGDNAGFNYEIRVTFDELYAALAERKS